MIIGCRSFVEDLPAKRNEHQEPTDEQQKSYDDATNITTSITTFFEPLLLVPVFAVYPAVLRSWMRSNILATDR